MIINIRGTSGSGKTHTARSFLDHYSPNLEIMDSSGKLVAHAVSYKTLPVYLIGSYRNICGGCDAVPDQDTVCGLVRHFSQFGHVIFEGLLISHLYARYKALYDELFGKFNIPFVYAYMDTPLELCIERVKSRRLAKGNSKPFNPENTISHYHATWKTYEKFRQDGVETIKIHHLYDPLEQIEGLLGRDPYMDFENSYVEESFR